MGREVGPDGVTRRDVNAGNRAGFERWAGVGHTQAMMESVRGSRSGGRENGVEGVFTSHHEVQVRLGHMAEAAVKDDGERNVVERRVVGGGVAGAEAARVAPIVVGILESSIGLLLFQSKFPAFQISIQHTETRQ